MKTPCDYPDAYGEYHCPFEDYCGYESERCRVCCGLGVDEDSYGYEDYADDYEDYEGSCDFTAEDVDFIKSVGYEVEDFRPKKRYTVSFTIGDVYANDEFEAQEIAKKMINEAVGCAEEEN